MITTYSNIRRSSIINKNIKTRLRLQKGDLLNKKYIDLVSNSWEKNPIQNILIGKEIIKTPHKKHLFLISFSLFSLSLLIPFDFGVGILAALLVLKFPINWERHLPKVRRFRNKIIRRAI